MLDEECDSGLFDCDKDGAVSSSSSADGDDDDVGTIAIDGRFCRITLLLLNKNTIDASGIPMTYTMNTITTAVSYRLYSDDVQSTVGDANSSNSSPARMQ